MWRPFGKASRRPLKISAATPRVKHHPPPACGPAVPAPGSPPFSRDTPSRPPSGVDCAGRSGRTGSRSETSSGGVSSANHETTGRSQHVSGVRHRHPDYSDAWRGAARAFLQVHRQRHHAPARYAGRPHDLHGHGLHHLREPEDPARRHPEPGAQGPPVRRRAHRDLPRRRRHDHRHGPFTNRACALAPGLGINAVVAFSLVPRRPHVAAGHGPHRHRGRRHHHPRADRACARRSSGPSRWSSRRRSSSASASSSCSSASSTAASYVGSGTPSRWATSSACRSRSPLRPGRHDHHAHARLARRHHPRHHRLDHLRYDPQLRLRQELLRPGHRRDPEQDRRRPDFSLLGQFDFGAFSKLGVTAAILWIFSLMLSDFFDTMGTLVGVGGRPATSTRRATSGAPPALIDSLAAVAGGAVVSSATTYIESGAGVAQGGRTGWVGVIVGVLFLLAMFFSPIAGVVPANATAPALIIVGYPDDGHTDRRRGRWRRTRRPAWSEGLAAINFGDIAFGLPAVLTMTIMPLTYSITNGIGAGFISYMLIQASPRAKPRPSAGCCGSPRSASSSTSPSPSSARLQIGWVPRAGRPCGRPAPPYAVPAAAPSLPPGAGGRRTSFAPPRPSALSRTRPVVSCPDHVRRVPLVALALILASAELFTNGIEWFGRRYELGEGAVGSVLAAVGTALPETLIPIIAILFTHGGLGRHRHRGHPRRAVHAGQPRPWSSPAAAVVVFCRRGRRPLEVTINERSCAATSATSSSPTGSPWRGVIHGAPLQVDLSPCLLVFYGCYVWETMPARATSSGDTKPLYFHRHPVMPHRRRISCRSAWRSRASSSAPRSSCPRCSSSARRWASPRCSSR